MSEIGAFWSYSRHDDPGQLQALHGALQSEVSALVGWDFRIWRDRLDIATGTNWREEIINGIHRARILIAIVTPRWLASPYCLEEYSIFLEAEQKTKQRGVIFPVTYIDRSTDATRSNAIGDRVSSDLSSRQAADWRHVREPVRAAGAECPVARIAVKKLADEIRDIAMTLPQASYVPRSQPIRPRPASESIVRRKKSRRIVPSGAPKRPSGPARIEISSGGNYSVDLDHIETKLGTHFEMVVVETEKYRFPIALSRASVQVDALQSDIDSDSCFALGHDPEKSEVTYKRLGEWEIKTRDGQPLQGDYFPGTPACRLVNCREEAGATARVLAGARDFTLDVNKIEETNKGFFKFSSPAKERLIEIWLRERVTEKLGGTRSEVILHQAELRTEIVDVDGD